jgi:ribulose-phosphate 3-epimerase
VRELLTATRSSAQIEVNGDVDESNVSSIVAACATIVMAGNAIFGAPDRKPRRARLRAASNGVVARGPDALPYCN